MNFEYDAQFIEHIPRDSFELRQSDLPAPFMEHKVIVRNYTEEFDPGSD